MRNCLIISNISANRKSISPASKRVWLAGRGRGLMAANSRTPSRDGRVTWLQGALRIVKPVLLLLALAFVVALLASQWGDLRAQTWRLDGGWLAVALFLLLLSWAVEIGIWRHLLAVLDGPLAGRMDFWAGARIWFTSAIVRYIPGNIWQPLSLTVQCSQRGIRAEASLISVVLFQVVTLLGVLPLAGGYLLLTGNLGLLTGSLGQIAPWLAGAGLAMVIFFVLRPGWLFGLLNWLLTKVGRTPMSVTLSGPRLLGLILAGSGSWILWGLTFAAVTFATVALPSAQMQGDLIHFVAAYPMAYAIGYLSFLTPSGLGVREGALFFWLEPVVGGGVATVAALAMRLLMTAGELILAGGGVDG